MKKISLYIHVPFCKKKCSYCDFVSYENVEENLIDQYFQALYEEIRAYRTLLNGNYTVETIFIGGGTPNFVAVEYIEKLMQVLFDSFEVEKDAEITMEANPNGHSSKEEMLRYKKAGINRLSLGLQSADDALLKEIGRSHCFQDFQDAFAAARQAGFDNVNIDLIFGFFGQDRKAFEDTVQYVVQTQCEHVSAYSLKLGEETPLYETYMEQGIDVEEEDWEDREMYRYVCRELEENGYEQYELSNFAKKGYFCKHNMNYWDTKEYIGFGVAAHSYKDHARFFNTSDLEQYLEDIKRNASAIEEIEQLNLQKRKEEFIIMGLRKTKGFEVDDYTRRFGSDFFADYEKETAYLIEAKLIETDKKNVWLTEEGKDFANIAMMEFITEINY